MVNISSRDVQGAQNRRRLHELHVMFVCVFLNVINYTSDKLCFSLYHKTDFMIIAFEMPFAKDTDLLRSYLISEHCVHCSLHVFVLFINLSSDP